MNDDDLDIHDPLIVIHDREGHVQPPLDQGWDDLTKLRWRAGLLLADTGIFATITTNCYSEPDWRGRQRFRKDLFGITIGNVGHVAFTLDEGWTFFNGVEEGARVAREAVPA